MKARQSTNELLFNAVINSERQARAGSLGYKVERLASLNAQIRAREDEAKELKAELLASGLDNIEGGEHRATITHSIRTTLDADKVRATLTPQQYAKCVVNTPVHCVRISEL